MVGGGRGGEVSGRGGVGGLLCGCEGVRKE